jgi:GxxExxY protein
MVSRRDTKKHRKNDIMDFDLVSKEIIGSAIEVHRIIGPGMLESAYEECLTYELIQKGLKVDRQKPIPVIYKEIKMDCGYRLDLLVDKRVIVEVKSVDFIIPVYEAQILTYIRFANIKIELLINFKVTILKNGLKRFVL